LTPKPFAAVAILVASLLAAPASASVSMHSFGTMPDGQDVTAIRLDNGHGLKLTVITLGAAVQSLKVPDRNGREADVVLGYDTLEGYLQKSAFFGATVGRVANRIASGRFTLDGKGYQIPLNNGPNALHGGAKGFDKVVWTLVSTRGGKRPSVTLRYVSRDGDMGFPGTLTATATYSLDEHNQLHIDYAATTDAPTIVNLSNHTYWNLDGEGSPAGAMNEVLTIPADAFTPTDSTAIPTGQFEPVAGTPFDFRRPTVIGSRVRDGRNAQLRFGRGYDHNWVISRTRPKGVQLMARLVDPPSGRVMEIFSNQPGLQFYSGNFLDGTIAGKSGHIYRQGDAVVLESQAFPDTPNHPSFGSIRLDPGQRYENHIVYRFTTLERH
jgi:aldose 1-epimerase